MFHDTTTVCVNRSRRNPVGAVITIMIMMMMIILVVILQPSIRFRFMVMDHGRMGDNVLDDVDDDVDDLPRSSCHYCHSFILLFRILYIYIRTIKVDGKDGPWATSKLLHQKYFLDFVGFLIDLVCFASKELNCHWTTCGQMQVLTS